MIQKIKVESILDNSFHLISKNISINYIFTANYNKIVNNIIKNKNDI